MKRVRDEADSGTGDELLSRLGVMQLLSTPSAVLSERRGVPVEGVRRARRHLMQLAETRLQTVSAAQLVARQRGRVSTGCPVLDGRLGGGLPRHGITELAGESGAGKTQLCLQLAVQSCADGAAAVYVYTEGGVPMRRLQQLCTARQLPADTLDRLLVLSVPDVEQLVDSCLLQLPRLMAQRTVRLLLVDSVAAPFRCQYELSESAERARQLQRLAAALRQLASRHDAAVLCVNQVTAAVHQQLQRPALGLAWATQVTTRLLVSRTACTLADAPAPPVRLMRLDVPFSPHLPPGPVYYQIHQWGVSGVRVTADTAIVPYPE